MAKYGRRPNPTHLKLLRGNPGHQALNKNEPQPDPTPNVPDPPEYLVGFAKDEWVRVCVELYSMKLLTRVDLQPLAAYCQAYAVFRTAVETYNEMAKRDPATRAIMVKAKTGTALQNPVLLTMRHAANDMVRYAAEFGFTPSARSRISTIHSDEKNSRFGNLLAG
jgi:P27 family predicted phage terminase small subunit